MLTSLISCVIYRSLRNVGRRKQDPLLKRELRKQYYYEQSQWAREYARKFDLTDEEIERRSEEEFQYDTVCFISFIFRRNG